MGAKVGLELGVDVDPGRLARRVLSQTAFCYIFKNSILIYESFKRDNMLITKNSHFTCKKRKDEESKHLFLKAIGLTFFSENGAFCPWTTRKSLVTISMTWPVWKTKSPFRFTASEDRQFGMLAWLRSSRVGELCEKVIKMTLFRSFKVIKITLPL